MDTVNRISFFQSLCDREHTQVSRAGKFFIKVIKMQFVISYKAVHALSDHTKTFLDDFLERATDRHDFTYRLHAWTDFAGNTGKLRQVPTRNLTDIVVELRSNIGRIRSTHFADLVEWITQRDLSGNECQRITGSLGSQCGRTAQTSVHFDHTVIIRIWVERILDITFTYNAQVTDTFCRQFLQQFQFFIVERASRSYNDRFTGVDTQRVEVFHAGNCETVVVGVADNFKFDFFPAFQGFFHQDLFGERERTFGQFQEFFFVGADTATKPTQCISRTYHYRITDLTCSSNRVFHAFYRLAYRSLHIDLVQLLHEQVAVFCVHDSLYRCTEYFHSVFIKNTLCVKLSTAVQCSLSAECQQDTVGAFFLDNFFYKISSYGKEIHFICNSFRSLNGCDVRVYQYWADAFFFQSFQCLWAWVVKFSGLSDFECSRTQNENFLDFLFHFFCCYNKLLFLSSSIKKMRYPQKRINALPKN